MRIDSPRGLSATQACAAGHSVRRVSTKKPPANHARQSEAKKISKPGLQISEQDRLRETIAKIARSSGFSCSTTPPRISLLGDGTLQISGLKKSQDGIPIN